MKKKIVSIVFAVALLFSLTIVPAYASPGLVVEDLLAPGDGLITLDTATGLRWLDVTATKGLSYNQAEASVYVTDYGFRHATYWEVRNLLESEGLILASRYYWNPNALALVNLMGGFTWAWEFTGWTDYGLPDHTIHAKLSVFGSRYKWDMYWVDSKDRASARVGNFLVRTDVPIDEAFLTPKKLNLKEEAEHSFKIHIYPSEPMDVHVGDEAEVYVDVDGSEVFGENEGYLAVVSSTDVDGEALDIAIKVYCDDLVDNDPGVAIYSINDIDIVYSDELGAGSIEDLVLDTFLPPRKVGKGK